MATEATKSERSSSALLTPPESASSRTAAPKTVRVLACLLCQRRKIKCDREFPCSNCIKASVQCVPATKARRQQRRRRFPERELLDRLRRYESLLRQNNIKFEPLHSDKTTPKQDNGDSDSADDEEPAADVDGSGDAAKTRVRAVNFWDAMNQSARDADDNDNEYDYDSGAGSSNDEVRESVVQKAWDDVHCWHESDDLLLFGSRRPYSHLPTSALHPEQSHILKLWQIYLDNVDPLLKVTHMPTLQGRIIDALSDMANINPVLEALMFSIYSVAILSLDDRGTCPQLFGSPKDDLLRTYRFACQQALLNCNFLLTDDRDCLTALYLYLVSIRPSADPRSLSCILGIAVRIAQRLGINNEPTDKCTAFEAEMRRRLWWSLAIFDHRVCEMCNNKAATLSPTWDCKTPLNVNDFDLRPEMKALPTLYEKRPTEALFVVIYSELGDFVRNSAFHLDFTNPFLKALAKKPVGQNSCALGGNTMDDLEKTIEERYLNFCNPETPLHFMAIWATKGWIFKNRLLSHYAQFAHSSTPQNDTERDTATSYAMSILECDTKLMVSPLTKGYHWFVQGHFPFPAYIHILQDMRKRPMRQSHTKAWNVLADNYDPRFEWVAKTHGPLVNNHLYRVFARLILQAWEGREAAIRQLGMPMEPLPRIVAAVRRELMPIESGLQGLNMEQFHCAPSFEAPMPMPTDFGNGNGIYAMGTEGYSESSGQSSMDVDVERLFSLDWANLDWNPMQDTRAW